MILRSYCCFSLVYCAILCSEALTFYLNRTLSRFSLDSHHHFNGALGSKIIIENHEPCSVGNYCVHPWWILNNTSAKNASTNNSGNTESSNDCTGIVLACQHACPRSPYSLPQASGISLLGETSDRYGNVLKYTGLEEFDPVSVNGDKGTVSLNFLSNVDRNAAVRFDISLDTKVLREDIGESRFVFLEGKTTPLKSNETDVSGNHDVTFIWCVEKAYSIFGYNFTLALYTLRIGSSNNQPTKAYESKHLQNGNISLFIRHVTQAPTITCFYIDGIKAHCLTRRDGAILQYLSLMSENSVSIAGERLKPITGAFTSMLSYNSFGQNIISDSEIYSLYSKSYEMVDSDCLCQSPSFPITSRFDWPADEDTVFGAHCLSANMDRSLLRINSESHSYLMAFDENITSVWMVGKNRQKETFSMLFSHPIQVLGFSIALTTLPESLTIKSHDGVLLSAVTRNCAGNSSEVCFTWEKLIQSKMDISGVPVLLWLLPSAAQHSAVQSVTVDITVGEDSILLINEFSVIASCACKNGGKCQVDHSARPDNSSLNYKCDCLNAYAGYSCERCADGFSFNNGTCEPCPCNSMGVCNLTPEGCVTSEIHCERRGCYCRTGESYQIDERNPKCDALLTHIHPDKGPLYGGRLITLTGKYIVAYQSAVIDFSDDEGKDNTTKIVNVTALSRFSKNESESIVLRTPPVKSPRGAKIWLDQKVEAIYFHYTANPEVHNIEQRNLSLSGGLQLVVAGDNLLVADKTEMITYLRCNNKMGEQWSTVCQVKTNNQMICESPNVTADAKLCAGNSSNTELSGEENMLKAEFGFRFDYLTALNNYTQDADNSTKFFIKGDPSISPFTNHQRELGPGDRFLVLHGKELATCCVVGDYKVIVGNHSCRVKTVEQTSLQCALPDELFRIVDGSSRTQNVTVLVGNLAFHPGVVILPSPGIWSDNHFKLAVVLGSALTVIISLALGICISCAYRRHYRIEMARLTKLLLLRDNHRSNLANSPEPSYSVHPVSHYNPPADTRLWNRYTDTMEYRSSHLLANNDRNELQALDSLNSRSYTNPQYFEAEI